MSRTLVVTNDFPPRAGGIQAFVAALATRLPAGSVVVYTSDWKGSAAYDATLPFPVVRHPGSVLLPTPSVLRRARELTAAHSCDSVWFGAAAPLGLMAEGLRRSGIERIVASTHGHEVGWARLPVARQALRRIGSGCDVVTYLGDYTRSRLAPALGPHPRLVQLPSGVDTETFRPDPQARAEIRARYGFGSDQPVLVCVSRLVERKGQDQLIRALPAVRQQVPGAALLIVGGGPDRDRLTRLVRESGVEGQVVLTGSVPWAELPAHYAAGDVFAMPCRSRRAGLEVEGLGIVFLEASATGLPVVAGNSGGSPDAVLEGRTGEVIDGRDLTALSTSLAGLLKDPARAALMGAAGRVWVQQSWTWEGFAARLRDELSPAVQQF
jgi:phosphatidylinositol alpha-1,6-mannosyltransferase